MTQAQWTWHLVPASTWRAANIIFDTDCVNQQSADTGSQLSHRTCWLGLQGETWHLWAQQAIPSIIPYRLYHNFKNYSCCAVLVEVDSRSHRSAELQEHKPWARPRSDQTRVRPELSIYSVERRTWHKFLYWKLEVFRKTLATIYLNIWYFLQTLAAKHFQSCLWIEAVSESWLYLNI